MRKWASKGALVLCLLFILVLSGCDFFTGIFDPLIAEWGRTFNAGITVTDTFTFHADNSWEEVLSATGVVDTTYGGTFTHDKAAGTIDLTLTTGGTGTASMTYVISSDRKTLTLTSGSLSFVYTRN